MAPNTIEIGVSACRIPFTIGAWARDGLVLRIIIGGHFLSLRTSPTASKLASWARPFFARTAESSGAAERLFNGLSSTARRACFVIEIPETLMHVTSYPPCAVKELDLQSRV
jgi:hypothetical protein